MKILQQNHPLSSESAFEIHRQLTEQGDQLFFRAALIAIVCMSIKYLGLELTEIDVPSAKVVISNPRIITGALGWFALFFVAASASRYLSAQPYAKYCSHLIDATKVDISFEKGPIVSTFGIIYALMLLLLIFTVAIALISVWSDMYYIMYSALARAFGWQDFIGPFDTCIAGVAN